MNVRSFQPEILDDLSADDPRAIQSRRDLRKVNAFMGHAGMVRRAIGAAPRLVVELGAGDGTFLLKVARRLRTRSRVRATLVDRRPILSASTREGFEAAGWDIQTCESDVFEWLCRDDPETADVTVANLFLHHFRSGELANLLNLIAQQTRRFVALDPRRSRAALAGASLLRLAGCNDVTLHDADVSVRAGFRDRELTALWPPDAGWTLSERPAGFFSHSFIAQHDRGM